MKLSERMMSIVKYVPVNSIVADIGTDHGYIPIHLIENNISKLVIAADVSKGSLNKTIIGIEEMKLQERIYPRLGDGLQVIKPFEVDTVVIAGMGGLLIKDILDKDKGITNSITNFILQPNIAVKELREYLLSNGFTICDEDLVKEDGKYYEIIFAKKGIELIREEIYYDVSPILIRKKHPLLKEYIEHKINSNQDIMEAIKDNKSSEKSMERYEELKDLNLKYKEILSAI